jgi:hypothetical protein
MLPELPPPVFASLVGVDVLPTTDYDILQVLNSTGSIERYSPNLVVFDFKSESDNLHSDFLGSESYMLFWHVSPKR